VTTTLDLTGLEEAVQRALARRDDRSLHVLGHGEISSVVAWPAADGPWACKRLPVFDSAARFDGYRRCFDDYLGVLTERGVRVHDSRLEVVQRDDSRIIAYCVQQALPEACLAPALLRDASPTEGRSLLTAVVERVERAIAPDLGLDAQLANWARVDGELVYLDVTTPLVRDERGVDRLDTDLFVASLPAALRPFVRRFVLAGILDTYYQRRSAALDLIGNLHKEQLAAWVPTALEIVNDRFELDLTQHRVWRYYRRDALLWSVFQRLRRVDRVWQHHVRRRAYPFLLPRPTRHRLGRTSATVE
jgi:uncharacterized protein DUF6206